MNSVISTLSANAMMAIMKAEASIGFVILDERRDVLLALQRRGLVGQIAGLRLPLPNRPGHYCWRAALTDDGRRLREELERGAIPA